MVKRNVSLVFNTPVLRIMRFKKTTECGTKTNFKKLDWRKEISRLIQVTILSV